MSIFIGTLLANLGIDNGSQDDGERFALLRTPDGIGLSVILAIRP
tara:strand:+ start:222 stop:356 length:135 start_codon:yes stop_codon:yes gene_type:complete